LHALTNLEALDLQGCRLTDKGLQPLLELKNLKKLALDSGADNQITDDGLRQIAANLGKLESLWLQSTSLSESGMAHLSSLTNLERLGLSGFAVGDQGLEPLLALERLQFLSLTQSQNEISDSGLLNIGNRLKNLEALWIRGSNITDAGVGALYELPRLNNVAVYSPHVTTEALLRFKAARPKVTAYFPK
jgi:hypothetical protein